MKCSKLLLVAAAGLLVASTITSQAVAEAQKKSKSKPVPAQQIEPKEDAVKPSEQPAPAPEPQAVSAASGAIMDILKKYQGQKTNLGYLNKVGRDFIEVKDESVLLTIPIQSIHSLKQVTEKDDNDKDVVRLDIKLFAKD